MTTVIKVENLGKKYLIGHEKQARYSTLRDSIGCGIKSVARRICHPLQAQNEQGELEEFWALKDINFEIQQGDKVGIIGRNGAGKSTLLKILSRITAPTTGSVTLKGRVASLLEVGTGFHPELSGRENIFLNGAILGMRKAEIKQKFDEIVAFAEVERFLDTPVKRYSSGMYVRLAFAVAAHLEPEILIVDEVLAVGDAKFQKKCLGKMKDVSKEGRTVLFVSHNLPMVQKICDTALLLRHGLLIEKNYSRKVLEAYLEYEKKQSNLCQALESIKRNYSLGELGRFTKISILNSNNVETNEVRFGEPFSIILKFKAYREIKGVSFAIRFDTMSEVPVVASSSEDINAFYNIDNNEEIVVAAVYNEQYIISGRYNITISCRTGSQGIDQVLSASFLSVENVGYNDLNVFSADWGSYNLLANWANMEKIKSCQG